MEVQFSPDVEAKLDQLAAETGRAKDEVVREAVVGYFDELAQMREMFDRRYEDIQAGRVKPISSADAIAHFRQKSVDRRS